ncbi:4-aminobutyrate aminotransferase PuuE [Planctomycetes bacterium Pan216]|uniref:4-aminobutyrate aminotransferase PuuE n=1 Tax=Kolteria novifilia TaxID=2527975 RepID=A0A518B987_9BACT|nr:4-aminobutyrate aminotransferase PuuE [Planctomycetes bacterium Pan216]
MLNSLERMRRPALRTEVPGPKAQRIIAAEDPVISPSYTRDVPLVVQRGQGLWLEDVDGNEFLDFTAGIAVCAAGHCHPHVVAAIKKQSSELLHMCGADYRYPVMSELAQALARIAPGATPKRVFFANSGAESIEAAIKLARFHTKRPHIIAFWGAFHGRTMGALSLTGSKVRQREGFGPMLGEVSHVPYPSASTPTDNVDPIRWIEENLFKRTLPADRVAAIVVEPIQGEGGYIVPPEDFHQRLRSLCDRHGILLVMDEIQSGMGRTGRMFAIEHWDVEPDIVCLAKGIASGMPLGAIVAKRDVMDWPPGAHASTFGGNPVACAAALATIELLEADLVEHAREMGEELRRSLDGLALRRSLIREVRGKGLMLALDLFGDPETGRNAAEVRDQLVRRAFERGLVILGCGESAIRFCPPLTVSRDEITVAMAILEDAMIEVEKGE